MNLTAKEIVEITDAIDWYLADKDFRKEPISRDLLTAYDKIYPYKRKKTCSLKAKAS